MLFDHNIACRQLILDSVKNLSSEDFTKELGVGYCSIRDILVHIINAEDYWVSLLRKVDARKLNPEDFNEVENIVKTWSEVESITRDFLENQNERTLQVVRNVTWDDITVHFTVAKALIHVAIHETHHRGLLIGLIRQLGYEPPSVDML
jgi:uncharacterized damage-inducible protein DinB